jgi:hypothetical protein
MAWFKKIFSVGKGSQQPSSPPPSPSGANSSPEELGNSNKMEQEREEREQKEKADDNLKLVVDGAKLQCPLCTNPLGTLKVTGNTPTIQNKLTATTKDNGKPNVLFMGTCSKSPNSASPCAAVMQLGQWQNTGSLKVQNEAPLLLKSTIKCLYGGVDIKITNCGQMKAPFAYDTPSPRKEEDDSDWIDITLGIYFDGTLNNKTNTEARLEFDKVLDHAVSFDKEKVRAFQANIKDKKNSYYNDFTNVARLWDFYDKNNSVYIEGIGTEDLKKDNKNGYAFGAGDTGVRGKVKKGCEKLFDRIKQLAPDKKIGTLTFDVFGFSRGAAASRNFVYEVSKSSYKAILQLETIGSHTYYIKTDSFGKETRREEFPSNGHLGLLLKSNEFEVQSIRIRFLGIFDTVSSYHDQGGVLDNALTYDFTNDEEELHLHALSAADKVVHFTADDEHRKNFALTRLKTIRYPDDKEGTGKGFIEKSFPGVHCDIGGAYIDGEDEIVKEIDYKALGTFYLERLKARLINEGWYKEEELTLTRQYKSYNYLTGDRKNLSNKYSFIPLHFMCEFAIKNKKSLPFIQDELERKFALKNKDKKPDELLVRFKTRLRDYVFSKENKPIVFKQYWEIDQEFQGSQIPEQRFADYEKAKQEQVDLRILRNRYCHWSANYKGFGMEPNVEDEKWERVKYPLHSKK